MDRTSRAVLNALIETCRDSERGFNGAAGLVTAPSLKALFLELAAQRARFAEELVPHAQVSVALPLPTGPPLRQCTGAGWT